MYYYLLCARLQTLLHFAFSGQSTQQVCVERGEGEQLLARTLLACAVNIQTYEMYNTNSGRREAQELEANQERSSNNQ